MTARLLRRLCRPSARRSRYDFVRDTSSAIERLEDRTLLAGMWTDAFPAGTDGFVSHLGLEHTTEPDIAIGEDGRYIVIWKESLGESPLYFRRFLPNGTPIDATERFVGNNIFAPSLGMAADGSFVIAYHLTDPTAGTRVAFSRFAADGTALQTNVLLGHTTRAGYGAEVAVARDGRFVITWVEQYSGTDYDIAFDVFAADGSSASGFSHADTAAGYQWDPDVAINPVTGEFAIAYEDASGVTTDVYRKIYRPDGTQLSGKRRLHADATGGQYDPAVAMNAAGDISIVWADYDGGLTQIWHGTENYYGLPGTTNTESLVVATSGGSAIVWDPAVVRSEGRDTFVVAWGETDFGGGVSKRYRQYNLAANSNGEPARTFGGFGRYGGPAVAMNARGDYVVAYLSQYSIKASSYTRTRAEFHRFQPFDQIGVFSNGAWSLDLNFNNIYDTGDTTFIYGQAGDLPVTGDWDGDGLTEVGIFRNGTWVLDANGNRQFDAADAVFNFGQAGDQPVVGDWNHDGTHEVGVFRNGFWYLDFNRNFSFNAGDGVFQFGSPGDIALVADPDNSGKPMLVAFRGGQWYADLNRNGQWDGLGTDAVATYGSPGDLPIAGNWLSPNLDHRTGRDQAAVLRGGTWFIDLDEDFTYEATDRQTIFGGPGMRPVRGTWAPVELKSLSSLPQRREVAIFRSGTWVLDGNGDGRFDGTIDLVFNFGLAGDTPVVGDWNADGLDEVGVFRRGMWYLDVNGNFAFDAADAAFAYGLASDRPVVGDWNGDGRDEIGVVRNGVWYLDTNGNRVFDPGDRITAFGAASGVFVTGDWNGDGRDEIGVFLNGAWTLDYDGDGTFTSSDRVVPVFGLASDQPVVGDWDGDGFDDIGVMRGGEWYLDRNGSDGFDPWDWIFSYGLAGDLALAGRWRVPA